MGIDRLGRSWRLSAWGYRTTRAWRDYGVKGSAELLIRVAWKTALDKSYEDRCPFISFGL